MKPLSELSIADLIAIYEHGWISSKDRLEVHDEINKRISEIDFNPLPDHCVNPFPQERCMNQNMCKQCKTN